MFEELQYWDSRAQSGRGGGFIAAIVIKVRRAKWPIGGGGRVGTVVTTQCAMGWCALFGMNTLIDIRNVESGRILPVPLWLNEFPKAIEQVQLAAMVSSLGSPCPCVQLGCVGRSLWDESGLWVPVSVLTMQCRLREHGVT